MILFKMLTLNGNKKSIHGGSKKRSSFKLTLVSIINQQFQKKTQRSSIGVVDEFN